MNRRTGYVALTAVALSLFISATASAACGASDVCADVSSILKGDIEVDAITVSWSTDAEGSTIDFYVIRRYDCASPSTCSVYVATVDAVGSCATNEDYSYEDDPPAPLSAWTYTVEVWTTGNVRSCAIDVIPE